MYKDKYDLESIFYVFLYFITLFKGPREKRVKANLEAYKSIPILQWFDVHFMDNSFTDMARVKAGSMALFEESIVMKLDKYWEVVIPLVRELKEGFFPKYDSYMDNRMTHDKMIEIFDKHIRRVAAYEQDLRRETIQDNSMDG